MKFKNVSSQPRKKRKRLYNAPLHQRQKLVSIHLGRELRKQLKKRSLPARKGDKILVLRGKFKKKEGTIVRVNLKSSKVYAEGIFLRKQRGTEVLAPLSPSALLLMQVVDRKKPVRKAKPSASAATHGMKVLPKKEEKEEKHDLTHNPAHAHNAAKTE